MTPEIKPGIIGIKSFDQLPKRFCPCCLHVYECETNNGGKFKVGYFVREIKGKTRTGWLYETGNDISPLARKTALTMRNERRKGK